jgi:uncharacterized protein (TIGR04255 family)
VSEGEGWAICETGVAETKISTWKMGCGPRESQRKGLRGLRQRGRRRQDMQQQVICTFENPPLDEVVLGIQFAVPPAFRATSFDAVHNLFKDEFPSVVDQPRLQPQFETFGGESGVGPGMHLEFGQAPLRNRVWFVSSDETHLVQFQDDRLLLNWRNRPGAEYPRYSSISKKFFEYAERLSALFDAAFETKLSINQAEVTYINVIEVQELAEVSKWLQVLDLSLLQPEGFSLTYSEIAANDRLPMGRFTTEIQSAYLARNRSKAIRLAFTFRGAPYDDSFDSAKAFLDWGHQTIVGRFCAMTTKTAHDRWGRTE